MLSVCECCGILTIWGKSEHNRDWTDSKEGNAGRATTTTQRNVILFTEITQINY